MRSSASIGEAFNPTPVAVNPNELIYQSASQLQHKNSPMMPAAGVKIGSVRRSPNEDSIMRNPQASPSQRAGNSMITEYNRHDYSIKKITPNSRDVNS